MGISLAKRYGKLMNLTDADYKKYFDKVDVLTKELELKHSRWSILEVVDHMDDVACDGTGLTLVYKDHWNDCGPIKKILHNRPTWKDLAKAADEAIAQSGDQHHCFVESFDYNEKDGTITLWTGS